MKLIVYGSYGYTGSLIAEKLSGLDFEVLLSGRNESKLKEQGETLKLPYQKASLDSDKELDVILKTGDAVLHCAGPFVDTWEPMAKACLRNGCHYLDITGEIEVFEELHSLDSQFRNNNLMAMPGTGFDVVPTDCMAAFLRDKFPGASKLELAFASLNSGVSRGTLKTMIRNLGKGGAVRLNGKIENVEPARYRKKVDFGFGNKEMLTVSIPWGDISTAYYSTGIKNITVYMAMPRKQINLLKLSKYLNPLLRRKAVRKAMSNFAEKGKPGPDKNERISDRSLVWGEASDDSGQARSAVMQTMEGYRLTSESAVLISSKVLNGDLKTGFQTPSLAYGPDLVLELDETVRIERA